MGSFLWIAVAAFVLFAGLGGNVSLTELLLSLIKVPD